MTDYFDADEEATVRDYLADGGSRPDIVRDDLHRRLLDAVTVGAVEAGPSLDTAVLVRHWLRRLSERDGRPYRARLTPGIEAMIQPFSDRVGLSLHGGWWGLSEDDGKPHLWFGAELRRPDLDQADWWQQHWAPWQQAEMATNNRSAAKMRRVIDGSVRVCAEIADEYRPARPIISMFGPAAMYMEPAANCGRCPQCRAEHIAPSPEEPHYPPQRWRPLDHDVSRLAKFIADIGSGEGLAVIVSPLPAALMARLGHRLLEIGVRHFAGCDVPTGVTGPVFHDAHFIEATDLTPWPTVAVLEEGELTGSLWLNRTARAANRPLEAMTLDVLVVADRVTLPRHLITRTGHAAAALLGVTSNGD